MRKVNAKSIYPDAGLWTRVKLIADTTGNVPCRVALRFVERGVKRWERRRQTRLNKT